MKKLLGALCFLTALLLATLPTLLFGQAGSQRPALRTLVIDAGHGGKDPGCLGKTCYEKDVALDVALQFGKLVETHMPEVKVIYTRKDDTFIPLIDRARIANNARADLFISIHCNAHPMKDRIGTETYVMGVNSSKGNLDVAMRENAVIMQEANYQEKYEGFDPNSNVSHILLSNVRSAYQDNSLLLAFQIEEYFQSKCKRPSRGVKQSGFLVLAKTDMPSVLVEIGFLTSAEEEKFLTTELGKASIASSLYKSLRDYRKKLEGRL